MSDLTTAGLKPHYFIIPLKHAPYTSLVLALSLLAYWVLQNPPVSNPRDLFEFATNLFRHKDPLHLGLNLFVIAYAGNHCETRKGGPFMLFVALASLLIGSIAEYLLIDARFIGLSAAAYGLAAWSAIDLFASTPAKTLLIATCFVAIIAAEFSNTAFVAHAAGALTGGLIAVFGRIFGKKPPAPNPAQADAEKSDYHLRPMTMADIPVAVEIIALTDEDDAEEAEENLAERHCRGMYVLEKAGQTIGISGFYKSDDVEDIAWLSWTYLHPSAQGKGGGRFMMKELLRILDDEKIRKLFIATSDYIEDGKSIYAAAHAFYESFGAQKELRVDDYHDSGEAMILYGFANPRYDSVAPGAVEQVSGIAFQGINAAEESTRGYEIQWESSPDMLGVTGLDNRISQARSQNARILFVALPDDVAKTASASLSEAGFKNCGMLQDYYEKGLGQVYWVLNMTQ
jgi:GNAT superfamily N-acetyltransferase/membrane associated rhomboid family serine protease